MAGPGLSWTPTLGAGPQASPHPPEPQSLGRYGWIVALCTQRALKERASGDVLCGV